MPVPEAGHVPGLFQVLPHVLRTRDDFPLVASHELCTPLASLRLQAGLLRRMPESKGHEPVGLETVTVRLDAHVDGSAPCRFDNFRMEQVVSNLIVTALRCAALRYGKGTSVQVSLRRQDGLSRLTVWDGGPGVPSPSASASSSASPKSRASCARGGWGSTSCSRY